LTSRCYYAAGIISRYVPEHLLYPQHRKRKSKKKMPMYQKKETTEENKSHTNHLPSPRRKRRPVGKEAGRRWPSRSRKKRDIVAVFQPQDTHIFAAFLQKQQKPDYNKMARGLPRYRCATDSYWSTSSASLLSVHGMQVNIGKKQNSVSFRSRSIKVKRYTPHANTYTERKFYATRSRRC
jgi:hypothetical protein